MKYNYAILIHLTTSRKCVLLIIYLHIPAERVRRCAGLELPPSKGDGDADLCKNEAAGPSNGDGDDAQRGPSTALAGEFTVTVSA
jgi:hypothetical protein